MPVEPFVIEDTTRLIYNGVRDHPYITSSLLGCHLTPTPPIVINRHIWYTPPPFTIVVLSYFNPGPPNNCYIDFRL